MTKTSRWLTGGRTNLFGIALGTPGAGELPNSAMYWYGNTPGWPPTGTNDLANYNQMKLMLGHKPDVVRLYTTDATGVGGIAGSAGNYGFIQPDWRTIANDGAILSLSFLYGSTDPKVCASNWGVYADALNAVGTNATKTDFNNFIQNLKRWHDDTGNTATIKAVQICPHHEPSNDGGTGANYVRYVQAIINYCLNHGVGDGPKPTSGPGSTYVGTWYDMVEWAHIAIGYDTRASAGEYAYYPGDGYVKWMLFDVYNWAGGQIPNGGTAATTAKAGGVPQSGATFGTNPSGPGHYTDSWKSLQQTMENCRSWYEAGPGGKRDVLMGLGEYACSEDIDTFPVVGNALSGARNKAANPHLKGDWFEGCRKWFRGEAWTAPNAVNNIVNTGIYFGPKMQMVLYWNSQSAGPRWWNTIPFQPGDTTGPSTTGVPSQYTSDKFLTLSNDSIFTIIPNNHTAPTITSMTGASVEGGDPLQFVFDVSAVAGDSAIVSYSWNFGDGIGSQVDTTAALTDEVFYLYGNGGLYTVTLTVTDTNALVVVRTLDIVVAPASSKYAHAPYIQPNDTILGLRTTYNPMVDSLEAYANTGGGTAVVAASGAAQTLADARQYRFQLITLTANCTITLPASPIVGMVLRVILTQDATGSRTVTWSGVGKWPAATAPVQTTTASSSDEYEFECVVAGAWRGRRVVADVR